MKLFEHPDFEQVILRATEHFHNRGLRAAIIEKDYYVTEALRLIATKAPDKIIFKGGTSLAKGWNLIQRFSEDIDIFLDPLAFKPRLGKNAIDRELKKLRDTVGSHAALTFVADESKPIGGFGRNDRFSYMQLFGGPGEVANRVLLEAGTASGREPAGIVQLRSYLGQFLEETNTSLSAEEEGRFPLRLLHRIVGMVEQANNIGVGGEDALERAGRNAFAETTEVAAQKVVAGRVSGDGALITVLFRANFCCKKTFFHDDAPHITFVGVMGC
jgi:Nucleotidyl transferase AbiEii toxin, Type IV TA system